MKLLLFCLFIIVLNLAVDFNNCVVLWDYAERYFINFFCYYSAQRLTSFSAKATYFLWSHHFSPLFIHPPFSSDFSFSFRRTAISKAWLYLVGLFYIAICLVPSSSGAKGTRNHIRCTLTQGKRSARDMWRTTAGNLCWVQKNPKYRSTRIWKFSSLLS